MPTGTRLAALLFFASGFSALVYQVIWQRMLALFSGVQLYSITTIVTAFMAGLGFGSLAGGRLADRLSRRGAIVAFALCELAIGAFALISPWLYYDLVYVRLGFLARYTWIVPLIHFTLLLPPTLLMGASLPLLSRALVPDSRRAARTIGLLYGTNTLGAAVGAWTAAWYLIGVFGFVGTVRLAALVNLIVAGGAMLMLRAAGRLDRQRTEHPAGVVPPVIRPLSEPVAPAAAVGSWCLLYAAAGFVALSLEIVWFRVLDVAIKSSPHTFGHLLGIFLGFLALGSLAGTALAPRLRRPDRVFLWCQWGVSAAAVGALVLLVAAPLEALGWKLLPAYWANPSGIEPYELWWSWERLGERMANFRFKRIVQVYLALPALLIGLPTFLMGFSFPCIQRVVQTDARYVGWRVGAIQASNIAGSILGSLITGALLLATIGTPGTLKLIVVAGTLFAALLYRLAAKTPGRSVAIAAVAASVAIALAVPASQPFWSRLHGAAETDLIVAEDAGGVAALHTIQPLVALRLNGKGHSLIPYADTPVLYGLLPVLMRPDLETALVIGLGTGRTAWAIGASPGIERIDVREISSAELQVLPRTRYRGQPYPPLTELFADSRIHIRVADGRRVLASTPARYDLIEIDALEPSMAYSGNLHSREFFELCRSRLTPRGLFVTLVPTERTRRTVVAAFPHVLNFRSSDFSSFIVASGEPIEFDAASVRARYHDEALRDYLHRSGETEPIGDLVERFLEHLTVERFDESNHPRLEGGDVNTDLFPRDEFGVRYDATYR